MDRFVVRGKNNLSLSVKNPNSDYKRLKQAKLKQLVQTKLPIYFSFIDSFDLSGWSGHYWASNISQWEVVRSIDTQWKENWNSQCIEREKTRQRNLEINKNWQDGSPSLSRWFSWSVFSCNWPLPNLEVSHPPHSESEAYRGPKWRGNSTGESKCPKTNKLWSEWQWLSRNYWRFGFHPVQPNNEPHL